MNANPLFNRQIASVVIGDLTFRLCTVDSLDEAIEYYVETAPDDTDLIPYYTMVWDSAKALAETMAEQPDLWPGRRVLELGCGPGLPSLVAARLGADVTATDYHPHNAPFFLENARLNGLETIHYARMDWREPQLEGVFDILLGSDLIYEECMVDALVDCVSRYCAADGLLLFADPGRTHLQRLCSALEQAGFESSLDPRGDIYLFAFRRRAP